MCLSVVSRQHVADMLERRCSAPAASRCTAARGAGHTSAWASSGPSDDLSADLETCSTEPQLPTPWKQAMHAA